jgi:hypothetical protein
VAPRGPGRRVVSPRRTHAMLLKPRLANTVGMIFGGGILALFGICMWVFLGGYLGLIPACLVCSEFSGSWLEFSRLPVAARWPFSLMTLALSYQRSRFFSGIHAECECVERTLQRYRSMSLSKGGWFRLPRPAEARCLCRRGTIANSIAST